MNTYSSNLVGDFDYLSLNSPIKNLNTPDFVDEILIQNKKNLIQDLLKPDEVCFYKTLSNSLHDIWNFNFSSNCCKFLSSLKETVLENKLLTWELSLNIASAIAKDIFKSEKKASIIDMAYPLTSCIIGGIEIYKNPKNLKGYVYFLSGGGPTIFGVKNYILADVKTKLEQRIQNLDLEEEEIERYEATLNMIKDDIKWNEFLIKLVPLLFEGGYEKVYISNKNKKTYKYAMKLAALAPKLFTLKRWPSFLFRSPDIMQLFWEPA